MTQLFIDNRLFFYCSYCSYCLCVTLSYQLFMDNKLFSYCFYCLYCLYVTLSYQLFIDNRLFSHCSYCLYCILTIASYCVYYLGIFPYIYSHGDISTQKAIKAGQIHSRLSVPIYYPVSQYIGTDIYDIAEAHISIFFESEVGDLKCWLCLSLVTCVGDGEENSWKTRCFIFSRAI